MTTTGKDLPTCFASPERDSMDVVAEMAGELRQNPLIQWFDAMPIPMAVINPHRQILFSNAAFCAVALKSRCSDVLGLRPGEALECIHAQAVEAGCGCSDFCSACGAARAIIKSLEGSGDCQECRMVRLAHGAAVPLDIQVFTRPVEFNGTTLSALFALDISHEKRLAYLNRTFHHGLVNGVGGINALADILGEDQEKESILELLADATKRTLKEVLYHRDLEGAERGRLVMDMESLDAPSFLRDLVREECRHRNTQAECASVEASCTEIWSDKRILGHVLGNLLKNALEARETATGDITLDCIPLEDGRTAISISNPGVIPPDIQKQLFKRYVSTKSRDRGLGVYAVRLFTERCLGGRVDFSSGNGRTTFTITLPPPPQRDIDDRQDP